AVLIETDATGVFHMTNRGVCSRYEFACQMLKDLSLEGVTITPIGSEAFPLPAPRAASEAMASERLASLGLQMPAWQESLQAYLHQFRFAKLMSAKTPGP
ncbi:MAG: sugar nucleotide-binding protein, partial [Candidatus Omnitrophica bacterium]|nr:sugar nucleotide-binding protein [Candidatus Omnitrophota bacterium]